MAAELSSQELNNIEEAINFGNEVLQEIFEKLSCSYIGENTTYLMDLKLFYNNTVPSGWEVFGRYPLRNKNTYSFCYKISMPEYRNVTFIGMLLDSIGDVIWGKINEYLSYFSLKGDEKIRREIIEGEACFLSEIIYDQAVHFMKDFTESEIQADLRMIQHLSMREYEKKKNRNVHVIFIKKSLMRNVENVITFERTFPFHQNNARIIRKLFELAAGKDEAIVVETDPNSGVYIKLPEVVGMVKDTKNALSGLSYYELEIKKSSEWALTFHSNDNMTQKVCRYEKGFYKAFSCPAIATIKKSKYEPRYNIKFVESLVNKMDNWDHGALIFDFCKEQFCVEEMKRLSDRGHALSTPINIIDETSVNLLEQFARIDGAIFTSESKCFGIGFIVDGKYENGGSHARGSRFNSSITYVKSFVREHETVCEECGGENCPRRNHPVYAFVVSDDGGIDEVHSDML